MTGQLNLLKLSVGSESVESMVDWQTRRSNQRKDGKYYHVTRMWPKREAELLDGGSIYWVVKGVILARQRILGLDEIIGQDGIRRCGIVLSPDLRRTEAAPKRPFQGWRYLKSEDAPADLGQARASEPELPPTLVAALAEIGVR